MIDVHVRKIQGDFELDVSFLSNGAKVTALFGHSGAGKTSLINMISGLSHPDSGHIFVNGRCIFNSQKKINIPAEKRRCGYVFQEARLFPHMSVKSNLTYGMKRLKPLDRCIKFDHVVDILGIHHLLGRHPAKLSGGEQQRVAIGRALLSSPYLLLMDEPLASLDAARKNEVLPFINKLSGELNIPILYVSHSLDEILNLAGTLVLLSGGKTLAADRLDKVITRPEFQEVSGLMNKGVVISTSVESHDFASSLTKLKFKGGTIHTPIINSPQGATVRVQILSRNVALSIEPLPRTSFQNIFKGTVKDVSNSKNGKMVNVHLDIGTPLIATITKHAQQQLGLKNGMEVFAMVKSASVSLGGFFTENEI